MSRPAAPAITAPAYTVRTFATDTNYPAGANPWNGQPVKVEPAGPDGGFVPDQMATPETFNKLFYDAFTSEAAAKTYQDDNATEVEDELAAHLAYTGQIVPLNWRAKVTVGAVSNRAAVYNPYVRRWLVVGDTEDARASYDGGRTWSGTSLVAAAGANENCYSAAVDVLGRAVIGTDSAYVFTLSAVDVAAKVSVWAGNTLAIEVAHDPSSAKFAAIIVDGLTAFVKTSVDQGATWANATTLPVQWSDMATYPAFVSPKIVADGAGRLVVVAQGTAGMGPTGVGTCRAMTSDDGGVTWTDRGTFATTITAPTLWDLSYNAGRAEYMYVMCEVSGTPTGEVWTSPDGVTWTKQKTTSASSVMYVAPNGSQWVGVVRAADGENHIVYSNDGGVEWSYAGFGRANVLQTTRGIVAGAGGFLCVNADWCVASLQAGQPSLGTIT